MLQPSYGNQIDLPQPRKSLKSYEVILHETADLVTVGEKVLNGKLHFLCSDLPAKQFSLHLESQNDLHYQNAQINAIAYSLFLLQTSCCCLYYYSNEF